MGQRCIHSLTKRPAEISPASGPFYPARTDRPVRLRGWIEMNRVRLPLAQGTTASEDHKFDKHLVVRDGFREAPRKDAPAGLRLLVDVVHLEGDRRPADERGKRPIGVVRKTIAPTCHA